MKDKKFEYDVFNVESNGNYFNLIVINNCSISLQLNQEKKWINFLFRCA